MSRIRLLRKPGDQPIDWTGVPAGFAGQVSAVVRTRREAEQLVRFYGSPNYAPLQPLLVMVPGYEPIIVEANGLASATKLRDLAINIYEELAEQAEQAEGDGRYSFKELQALGPNIHRTLREMRIKRVMREKENPITAPPDLDYAPRQMPKVGRRG